MLYDKLRTDHFTFTIILGLTAAFFVICIVLFPDKALAASLHGLTIWWKIIFPGLLPFLILSEILLAYGVLHLFGVLIEPMMRLLFKLPGISGPVFAAGCTVGFPTGAKLTSTLRKKGLLSQKEGESLLSISHLSSPVLIMNVIAVGFFHNVQLGMFLILIQIISLITMGILFKLFDKSSKYHNSDTLQQNHHKHGLIHRAFTSMKEAHHQDGRTFGKLLGDAVNTSIQTLMMIGGYIMIFSVIVEIITLSNITNLLVVFFKTLIPESIVQPLFIGFFEVHLGAYAISQIASNWNIALISLILAWSGISLHLQVKSIISDTDLRYSKFLIARLIHALLALWFSVWLWKPLNHLIHTVNPTFSQLSSRFTPHQLEGNLYSIWSIWGWSIFFFTMIIAFMVGVSVIIMGLRILRS